MLQFNVKILENFFMNEVFYIFEKNILMKYKFLVLKIFLLISFLAFYSCNIEPIDPKVQTNQTSIANTPTVVPEVVVPVLPVFKVNFDAQVFAATNIVAVKGINAFYTISGSATANGITRKITIYFSDIANNENTTGLLEPNELGKGLISYNINSGLTQNNVFKSHNKALPTSTTGSIKILNNDTSKNLISGIFNATVYLYDVNTNELIGSKVLSNGIFTNIEYQNNAQNPDNNTFFAKVDGLDFVEDAIDVVNVQSSGFPDSISITAKKTSGEKIILSINKDLVASTYNITGPLNSDLVSGKYFINNSLYYANSGNVIITSKTATRVAGTFQFISSSTLNTNTQNISQGSFDVNY